jgi:hypothetical protein
MCKTCKIEKDLNVQNFERRNKLTGRMSLVCKPCNRIKVRERERRPEVKERNKKKYLRLKEWYRQYHKSEKAKQKQKERRQTHEHKKLRLHLSRKRELAKKHRTPPWADLDKIKEFYKNCPKDMTVDHIIPLQGKNVSGLHIFENLQYLTRLENFRKGNRYE